MLTDTAVRNAKPREKPYMLTDGGEITAPELLTCLRRIEERGALDTAHRAHQNCGQIFRYAVATGSSATSGLRRLQRH